MSLGSLAKIFLIEVGNWWQTATKPCGVTVSAIESRTSSVTYSISTSASSAAATISGWRSSAVGVANDSISSSGR